MTYPEVEYERIVTLNKYLVVYDGRFKNGKKRTLVNTSYALIPDGYDGTTIAQNHIHKDNGKMIQTIATSQVSFPLHTSEVAL